eukprot:UN26318
MIKGAVFRQSKINKQKKSMTNNKKTESDEQRRSRIRRRKQLRRQRTRSSDKNPETAAWLIQILKKQKLFSTLHDNSLSILVHNMVELTIEPGDVLIKQGEVDQAFYVVSSGKFDVYVCDECRKTGLGRGVSFGDRAMMDKGPRTASVKASCTSHVFKLTPDVWQKLSINPSPSSSTSS